MENEEKDIIRQLAGKLRESEMPYREGAWERFAALRAREANANAETDSNAVAAVALADSGAATGTSGRLRSLLRPWVGVAAVLLLAIGAGWLYLANHKGGTLDSGVPSSGPLANSTQPDNHPDLKQGTDPLTNQSPKQNANAIAATPGSAFAEQRMINQQVPAQGNNLAAGSGYRFRFPYAIEKTGVIHAGQSFSQSDRTIAESILVNALAAINTNEQRSTPGLRISPVGPVYRIPQDNQQIGAQTNPVSAISDEQKATASATNDVTPSKAPSTATAMNQDRYFDDKGYFDLNDDATANKWDMGVMVIPAVSNDAKLNMGYGLSVGYNLNNKLSINSGVAYTQLTGSRNADQQASLASGGRTLSSIDATATGINVPLELRYHFSKKIYIGTGVSAMAVLSDKVERKYAIAEMQTSAFEAKNGQPLKPDAMQSIAANVKTKEVIPEDQIGSKDFAGFINFSFGFKQPLNKSKSLSIEPFISVPMSNHLFNQNIKMTDGGLRIKLGL